MTYAEAIQDATQAERDKARASGGSQSHALNMDLLLRTIAATYATERLRINGVDVTRQNAPTSSSVETVMSSMRALAPSDAVEGMLAGQAVSLHHAAMEAFRRAAHPDPLEANAVEAWKAAADLSRTMLATVEALDRRRAAKPLPSTAHPEPAPAQVEPVPFGVPPCYPPTPVRPSSIGPEMVLTNEELAANYGYRGRTGLGPGYSPSVEIPGVDIVQEDGSVKPVGE